MNNPENNLEEEHIHPIEGISTGDDGIEDISDLLGVLKPVHERDPDAATASKQAFLEQARELAAPVSPASGTRLKGWNIFARKERTLMTVLARLALVLAIALGGSGVTAFAAQASMPSDLLYPFPGPRPGRLPCLRHPYSSLARSRQILYACGSLL